ncbi:Zn(2+)-responsive transcriptional regulator [Pleionea sediminis]|uniref:Zn(2+)-responsive transcriptional regulator n=1 Tax=Pleionea sediminis TaxID=2569479 RepID=UPI001186B66A|nr:Zn(2+)-responsive transcriptional regulator [Pleionea sediminis]
MFKIKQAALLSGFSVDTLRFYDKNGLAEPSKRSQSGYRLYSDEDIMRLRFIKHAKQVGFSLDSVKELLDLRSHKDEKSCEDVKEVTRHKLEEVDQRIQELTRMRSALLKLYKQCDGGDASAEQCTILKALDDVVGASV